jgi:hypothetical protein
LGKRLSRLIGTTPRARLLSAGTAVTIVVAIAAFIALKPSEGDAVQDSYTRGADRLCVEEKQRIVALEQAALHEQQRNIGAFAAALVTVVAEWRSSFRGLSAPPIHAEGAEALNTALLDVLIRAGTLARVAQSGSARQIAAKAALVDAASAEVDRQVEQLGLEDCAAVAIGHPASG